MMSNNFSVQFKLGIAGIIASIIWIASKFGLFSISSNEWLSLCGVIFSFTLFLHHYEKEKKYTLLSIFLFFFSITFLVYFHQVQIKSIHSNFDFSFLIYVFGFSLGAFLLAQSFVETQAIRSIFIALVLLIGTFLSFIFYLYLKHFKQNFFGYLYFDDIKNFLITLSLFLILFYLIKDIFKSVKEIRKKGNDVPLS